MLTVIQAILFVLALAFIVTISFLVGYSKGKAKARLEYEEFDDEDTEE